MDNIQSNTQQGSIMRIGSVDLSTKNGYLAKLNADAEAALPTSVLDLALFVVIDGDAAGANATIQPLTSGEEIRVKAKGTGNAGDVLVLADPATAADAGKVRALPATAGQYFAAGIAEEDFVDGQLVLVRPMPRIVNVSSADSLTALTFTAGAATGPEVAALRNAIVVLLKAHGIVTA